MCSNTPKQETQIRQLITKNTNHHFPSAALSLKLDKNIFLKLVFFALCYRNFKVWQHVTGIFNATMKNQTRLSRWSAIENFLL